MVRQRWRPVGSEQECSCLPHWDSEPPKIIPTFSELNVIGGDPRFSTLDVLRAADLLSPQLYTATGKMGALPPCELFIE